jgi:primosomal protein N' (replication factor Y)
LPSTQSQAAAIASGESPGAAIRELPYADVAVDVPTEGRDDLFTYSIPLDMEVELGHLVRVPFGPRTVHGVVVRLTADLRVDYTKPLLGLVRPEPLLTPVQMELARWVSEYYRTTLFDAMAPMLPPGFRARTQTTLRLLSDTPPPDTELTPAQGRLLAYLRRRRGAVRLAPLVRQIGSWVPRAVQGLAQAGLLEERWEWEGPRVGPQVRDYLELSSSPAEALEWVERWEKRAPRRAALLRRLAEPAAPPYMASVARREYGAGAVTGLVTQRLARLEPRRVERSPLKNRTDGPPESPLAPTEAQAEALAQVRAALDDPAQQPRTMLLHGVTGSGKTEVYLQALAHCIAQGKRGIVLVPEHSLAPQTMDRFSARFPGQVAVLHSGLTAGQQFDQWWRVWQGAYSVVVGSRSGIFAPQRDLGLVILDEEHEWTYKQHDATPRYHAREVALKLAGLTGAVVLLGSATPDIVSFHNARQARYLRLDLPSRIDAAGNPTPLADVQIVDMRQELKQGNRSVFSRLLQEGLERCLSNGRQAILFLNRRGAASVVQCRSCGFVLRCWRCASPYTYHGTEGLICHHCNRRRSAPSSCPQCHGLHIRYLGLGTQRLVEEAERSLPGARVLRWDRDTARHGRAHEELLARFAAGEADVLVGTQMIAKGLHLPSVTLVGVVLADIGLNVPDYRAAERTFQVICQVAGRAGRASELGRVVVQTYLPDHYAIQAAARQNYEAFYDQEMTFRRAHGNPPVSRLIRLLFSHTDAISSRREAQRLGTALKRTARQWGIGRVDVIGPAPAYPPRLRGVWRWHILLRGADPRSLLDKVTLPPYWTVDVDPVTVV